MVTKQKKIIRVVHKVNHNVENRMITKRESINGQKSGNTESKSQPTFSRLKLIVDISKYVPNGKVKTIRIIPRVMRKKTLIVRKRELTDITHRKEHSAPRVLRVKRPEPIEEMIKKDSHSSANPPRIKFTILSTLGAKAKSKLIKIVKRTTSPVVKVSVPLKLELVSNPDLSLKKRTGKAIPKVSNRTKSAPKLSERNLLPEKKNLIREPCLELTPQIKVPAEKNLTSAEKSEPVIVNPDPTPSPETVERARKIPDRWSECGQIFYTGGQAFGISSNLRTICIGTQSDVDSFFQHGKPDSDLNFIQLDTLKKIKEIRLLEQRRAKEAENNPESKDKIKPSRLKFGGRFIPRKRIAKKWSSRRLKSAIRR